MLSNNKKIIRRRIRMVALYMLSFLFFFVVVYNSDIAICSCDKLVGVALCGERAGHACSEYKTQDDRVGHWFKLFGS